MTFARAVSVLVSGPDEEPLTIAQGKLRAGLDWTDGDPRDELMAGFIAAARQKVEQDTGLALLTQTRDIYSTGIGYGRVLQLPPQSLPLQEVVSITYPTGDVVQPLTAPPTADGRIVFPDEPDIVLTPYSPFVLRIISGWTTPAGLPPLLAHAVGLLTAHYATAGRDLTTIGTIITTTPEGYEAAIAPFVIVSLA